MHLFLAVFMQCHIRRWPESAGKEILAHASTAGKESQDDGQGGQRQDQVSMVRQLGPGGRRARP